MNEIKSSTIHIRVNPELREDAEKVLKPLGTNLSAVFELMLRQIVLTRGIPFPIVLPNISEIDNGQQVVELHAKFGDVHTVSDVEVSANHFPKKKSMEDADLLGDEPDLSDIEQFSEYFGKMNNSGISSGDESNEEFDFSSLFGNAQE